MEMRKVLRVAIVAEWILVAVTLTLSAVLERFLPAPLQDYLKAQSHLDLGVSDLLILAGLGIFLVGFLTSTIGLFAGRPWARWVYLGAEILGCVLMLFMGPNVGHMAASAFESATAVVSGLILGIAFFTDALTPRLSVPPGANVPVPE